MSDPKLVSFENTFFEDKATLGGTDDVTGALACVTVDGYPAGEDPEGCVVAKVWMTNAREIIVDWHRNDYRMNSGALAAVKDSIETLKQTYPVTGLPQYHPKTDEMREKLDKAAKALLDIGFLLDDMSDKAPGRYTVDCYIRDIGRAFHHHCKNEEDANILADCLIKEKKVDGCMVYADDTRRVTKILGYCGY